MLLSNVSFIDFKNGTFNENPACFLYNCTELICRSGIASAQKNITARQRRAVILFQSQIKISYIVICHHTGSANGSAFPFILT